MEFLNPPIPNSRQISSTISVFPPPFPLQICRKNRARRFRVSKSANPQFTTTLASSTPQSFRLSPHFGRPTRRRNSLRKNLADDPKVRQKPLPLYPIHEFQNPQIDFNEDFQKGLNSVSDDEIRVYNENLGNSNLLMKLENWVENSEILTISEDFEGNVRVNKDEISSRNQDAGSEIGELSEANSKILYEKNLAMEMERGKNVIPRSSSVAKFVVDGKEKLSLVNAIQDAIFRPDSIPKGSKVGALVVCCVVVFWVVKKSFSGVEVMQEPVLFEKSKLKVKAAEDALASRDFYKHLDSQSSDFDQKVEEIKVMARQAREIESRDRSLAEKYRKEAHIVDEQVVNETDVVKNEGKEEGRSLNGARIVEGNGAVVSMPLSEPL